MISLLCFALSTATAADCDQSFLNICRVYLDATKKAILENMTRRDISPDLQNYNKVVSYCDDLLELAIPPGITDKWQRIGKNSEVENRILQINFLANIRDVSKEVKALQAYVADDPKKSREFKYQFLDRIEKGRKAQRVAERNCESVDLSKDFGEIRDQGVKFGWCFDTAAADILSYKLGKRVSAVHLASRYYDKHPGDVDTEPGMPEKGKINVLPNPNYPFQGTIRQQYAFYDLSGGQPEDAVRAGLERGLCLEKEVGVGENDVISINYFKQFELLMEAVKKSSCEDRNPLLENPANVAMIQQLLPGKNLADIYNIFQNSERTNLFEKLIEKSCTPVEFDKRLKVNIVKIDRKNVYDPGRFKKTLEFIESIDRQLDKRNPILIGINGQVLRTNELVYPRASHAVNLIGRRYNKSKERCEYLVRNTWGKDCSYKAPDYDCKDGALWIPKGTLASSIDSIMTIEP